MPDNTSYNNNAAAWNTAGQLMSTAANVTAQSSINRRTMKYNKEMLALQRQQALDDWQMQNEYNHPSSQMARFREAGLNENLIYGQTNTADAVKSTSPQSWNPKAPDYSGIGTSISSYLDTKIRQQQYDNLRTQNTIAIQDAMIRAATADIDVKAKSLQYGLDSELRNNSLEAAKLTTDKLREEVITQAVKTEELSYQIMNLKQQIGEAPAGGMNQKRMDEINERIEVLRKNGTLKDFEIELSKINATKGDPYWLRLVAKLFTSWGL